MPTIINPILTLNKVATGIEIVINYQVDFTLLEKNLVNLGLSFAAQVVVLGVDPPRSAKVLRTLEFGSLPVTFGSPNPFPVTHKRIVPRALLDEDPTIVNEAAVIPDNDEISCRVAISPKGLPDPVVAFTNQFTLFEDPVLAASA